MGDGMKKDAIEDNELVKEIEDELRANGLLHEPTPQPCHRCGAMGLNHIEYEGANINGLYCDACWQEADSAEFAIEEGRMTQEEWSRSGDRKSLR